MALEPYSIVTVVQKFDERNISLFQDLNDTNEDLKKTISKMETRTKTMKTWRLKTVLQARRQKHALKKKDETIKDLTHRINSLKEENEMWSYYHKHHGCMGCSGELHCVACGY